jgi:hypothetical protein
MGSEQLSEVAVYIGLSRVFPVLFIKKKPICGNYTVPTGHTLLLLETTGTITKKF